MWECKKCRTRNSDNLNYCPNCGTKKDGEQKASFDVMKVVIPLTCLVFAICAIIVTINSSKGQDNSAYANTASGIQNTAVSSSAGNAPTVPATPKPTQKPVLSPTPAPTPTPKAPGPDDIWGCNENVVYPNGTWLSNYETKYVKTKHGVRAYLRYEPKEDSDYYSYVYERDEVTVLARQNGYSLVKTTDGMAGWVTSSVLVDSY